MERKRFIYLAGFMPIAICSVLLFLWLLTGFSLLGWLGVIMSLVGILITLAGFYHSYVFYNDKSVPDKERKDRRKHFLWHTTVLSVGLVLSFQCFQIFRQASAVPGREPLTIMVKNTSDKPAKNIRIKAGMFNELIKELPARGEKDFKLNLVQETTLTAELGTGAMAPKATLQVSPSDHTVLIRLDYNQNILPEVQ